MSTPKALRLSTGEIPPTVQPPAHRDSVKALLLNEHEAWLYYPDRVPVLLVDHSRHIMLLIDFILAPVGWPSLTAYNLAQSGAEERTDPGLPKAS